MAFEGFNAAFEMTRWSREVIGAQAEMLRLSMPAEVCREQLKQSLATSVLQHLEPCTRAGVAGEMWQAHQLARPFESEALEVVRQANLAKEAALWPARHGVASRQVFEMADLPSRYHELMATTVLPELRTARAYLDTINFSALKASVGADLVTALKRDLSGTTSAFEAYIATTIRGMWALEGRAVIGITQDIRTSTRALRSSGETVYHLATPQAVRRRPLRAGGPVVRLLRALDPELAKMYIGAVEAHNGRRADWARHVGVSLRELLDQVLLTLAPAEAVEAWQVSRSAPIQISRRQRIKFIRASATPEEIKYVDEQLGTLENLCAALNAPTHGRRSPHELAMRGYIRVVEGCLLLILGGRRGDRGSES